MSKTHKITEAEWLVMEVIWEHAPATATEIVRLVQAHRDWHANTIRTMIQRLATKGLLTLRDQAAGRLYRAKVSRAVCVRRESRSLIERLFGGDTHLAVAQLLQEAELNSSQLDELKRLIAEMEAEEERP